MSRDSKRFSKRSKQCNKLRVNRSSLQNLSIRPLVRLENTKMPVRVRNYFPSSISVRLDNCRSITAAPSPRAARRSLQALLKNEGRPVPPVTSIHLHAPTAVVGCSAARHRCRLLPRRPYHSSPALAPATQLPATGVSTQTTSLRPPVPSQE